MKMTVGQRPIKNLAESLKADFPQLLKDDRITHSIDELINYALLHASTACTPASVAIPDIARISKSFTDKFVHPHFSIYLAKIDLYIVASAFSRLCEMEKPTYFMRSCADFIITYIINSRYIDPAQASSFFIALSSNNPVIAEVIRKEMAKNSPEYDDLNREMIASMKALCGDNPFMAPSEMILKINSLESSDRIKTIIEKATETLFKHIKSVLTLESSVPTLAWNDMQQEAIFSEFQDIFQFIISDLDKYLPTSSAANDPALMNELLLLIGLATSEKISQDIENCGAPAFYDSHHIVTRILFRSIHQAKDQSFTPSKMIKHLQFLADRASKFITQNLYDLELPNEINACQQQWQQLTDESGQETLQAIDEILAEMPPRIDEQEWQPQKYVYAADDLPTKVDPEELPKNAQKTGVILEKQSILFKISYKHPSTSPQPESALGASDKQACGGVNTPPGLSIIAQEKPDAHDGAPARAPECPDPGITMFSCQPLTGRKRFRSEETETPSP